MIAGVALRAMYEHKSTAAAFDRDHAVPSTLFVEAAAALRRTISSTPGELFGAEPQGLQAYHDFVRRASVAVAQRGEAMEAFLTNHVAPLLLRLIQARFSDHVSSAAAVRKSADLRSPHLWFPRARAFKRHIVFHAGPTNSGKTYHALKRLKEAASGIYCGPLRLLALEVFESLNSEGVEANLLTGQERRDIPWAKHVSCTVETVDVEKPVDVAVIDEIQVSARVLQRLPAASTRRSAARRDNTRHLLCLAAACR